MQPGLFDKMTPFQRFHRDNPQVYELFKRFTFEVIEAGHKKFSADAILHRIRWEAVVETEGETFKVNNNYTADYARLFMRDFPQHAGFFNTRERKAAA